MLVIIIMPKYKVKKLGINVIIIIILKQTYSSLCRFRFQSFPKIRSYSFLQQTCEKGDNIRIKCLFYSADLQIKTDLHVSLT